MKVAKLGCCWTPEASQIRRFRRYIYQFDRDYMRHLIQKFSDHQVCDRGVLIQLMKNPKVREKYGFGYDSLMQTLKTAQVIRV